MDDDPRVYPVAAPGWAALDRALRRIHPGKVPHQFASRTPYEEGSPHPLPAVMAFAADGPAHWHLVGYGCSELFDKTSPHPDVSGFGFEPSLRIPRRPDDERPPMWAVTLLQAVGHHVLFGGARLDTGHVVDLGGPIRPEPPTELCACLCVPDPQLGKLDTPNGSVLVLQLFGLRAEERDAVAEWDLARKVHFAREVSPLCVTDPDRPAFADDPRTKPIYRRYRLGVLVDD